MASESPANDPGTPKASSAEATSPSSAQPAHDTNGSAAPVGPQGQPFPFYPGQDAQNGDPPHDGTNAEPGGGMGVPVPYPSMPVYPYGNVLPGPPLTRPKRTQCKNACTNCQKACKKCDDNRPCHRCIRYGTTDTCVDSKRKERKKGVKRGPYKKRDSKGVNADAENDDGNGAGSANGAHGPSPNMPYVGPVGYPPGMWSSYSPGGPGGKLEGGGYYQPVFALTPVGGQPPHGGDGESAGGGGEAPHFPVGFYPATFISYPGPYPPYPMPQGQGSPAHGFHYAYPPPPGVFQQRPPITGNLNGDQSTSGPSADAHAKEASDAATLGNDKDKETFTESQVNGKVKVAEPHINGTAGKDA
ncbi:hypothetical protein K439DRAFT_1635597, partial [Ramaria rubella]